MKSPNISNILYDADAFSTKILKIMSYIILNRSFIESQKKGFKIL